MNCLQSASSILVGLVCLFLAEAPQSWNFDADALGKLPAGWTADRTSSGPGSVWKVRADDSASGKNRFLSQTASDGAKRQFNLCVTDVRYRDLDLSVKIRPREGKIDQGGGVVWRYRDAQNYYLCRWNPLEDNFRAYKVVAGKRSQMDTAKVPGNLRDWQTLRIVQVGREFRGYFNGKLLLEVEDDEFPEAGRIGLWTKSDAVTDFDEFTARTATDHDVEELKNPPE